MAAMGQPETRLMIFVRNLGLRVRLYIGITLPKVSCAQTDKDYLARHRLLNL